MDEKYGKLLGPNETHKIFPFTPTQFKRGVIMDKQNVTYIKIVLSDAARYPNIVDKNWIKYSKTPEHAALLRLEDVFKIKVCVGLFLGSYILGTCGWLYLLLVHDLLQPVLF